MIAFDHATHTYTEGGRIIPSVTQALADCGIVAYGPRTEMMEYYLQRGVYVHECIALWCEGALDEDSIDPAILPYVDAARECILKEGWQRLFVEQVVGAEIPRVGWYAGRYDLMVMGGPLVDWKTGEVRRWTRLQLAALAYAACRPDAPRLGIRLNADGTYEMTQYKHFRADMRRFAACLAVYYEKHPSKRRKRPINGTEQAILAEAL